MAQSDPRASGNASPPHSGGSPSQAPSSTRSPSRSRADEESRRLWRLAGMGGTMASEIVAGALIGWFLDSWLGTAPILLIVLTIAGMVVGLTTFIRSASAATKVSTADAKQVAATLRAEAAKRAEAAEEEDQERDRESEEASS